MGVQILEEEAWVPPLVVILFGPPGSWKTSTLGCAEGAVWGDFHGSTKTFQRKPRRLWDPVSGAHKPSGYPDLVDVVRDVAADKKLLASLGPRPWLMLDGLDDIEEQYLIPEALRRADAKTLDENFFKPCNHLLAVHQEFRHELEALTRAGWSLGFTCHAQNIERVNADGVNTLVCDMKLTYVSGKLGKWDIAPLWRDWADHCVYLDQEGGKFSKLDKAKARVLSASSKTIEIYKDSRIGVNGLPETIEKVQALVAAGLATFDGDAGVVTFRQPTRLSASGMFDAMLGTLPKDWTNRSRRSLRDVFADSTRPHRPVVEDAPADVEVPG